jgi:hypothetical protein
MATRCKRAPRLWRSISEPLHVAATLRQAVGLLRSEEYSAVLVDQSLIESDPDESDLVLQHMGSAIPVYINFGISGLDRVVRELRSALHRCKREAIVATRTAEQNLRNELKGPLTALLLSCEMALEAPDISVAGPKIRKAWELAKEVRSELGANA